MVLLLLLLLLAVGHPPAIVSLKSDTASSLISIERIQRMKAIALLAETLLATGHLDF